MLSRHVAMIVDGISIGISSIEDCSRKQNRKEKQKLYTYEGREPNH